MTADDRHAPNIRRALDSLDAIRADWADVEAAEAALAAAEARRVDAAAERAITVAWLRSRAEQGGDPWMAYVADEIEAGLHVVMHDF